MPYDLNRIPRPAEAAGTEAARLGDELRIVRALSMAYPAVFLCVAAFMVNAVLARLVRLQREQIAQLKALGYTSWQVGRHYLGFAFAIVGDEDVLPDAGAQGGLGGGDFDGVIGPFADEVDGEAGVALPEVPAAIAVLFVNAGEDAAALCHIA